MKTLLFLLAYLLIVYGIGIKVEQWLQADYQKYLDNFDGRNLYIAPFDFSWVHWWFMGIVFFFIILSFIGLIKATRQPTEADV